MLPSNALALRSLRLTVILAMLLAGSVIFNIVAISKVGIKLGLTETIEYLTSRNHPNSNKELVTVLAKQQDAARLQQIANLKADIAHHLNTVATLHRERVALLNRQVQADQQLALTKQQLAISRQKLAVTTAAARRVGIGTTFRVRNAIKRQFTTVAGKLVPVIGTAVGVASFGYDVYELCATMTDIVDLNRAIGEPAGDDGVIDTFCRAGQFRNNNDLPVR